MPVPHDTPALEQRHDRVRNELASIGVLRPERLREKYVPCGKPSCRCQREDDPGHGPCFVLDCQAGGRRTTRSIPSERVAETRTQVEECQRLRRLTSELIELSKQLCDTRSAEQVTGTDKKSSRQRVRRRHQS